MANSIVQQTAKAIIAPIKYAGMEFDGLMLPDSSYAIGVPQVAILFGSSKNTFSRDIKRLLGKDFSPSKISTEISKSKVNVLTLEQFSQVVLMLAFNGNEIAQRFALASVQEKIERVFDNAFGVVVEEREREAKFYARLQSKATFRPLTDALQSYGYTEGWQYGRFIKRFQEAMDIECGTRDMQPMQKLMELSTVQGILTHLIKSGLTPDDALTAWLDHL